MQKKTVHGTKYKQTGERGGGGGGEGRSGGVIGGGEEEEEEEGGESLGSKSLRH